MNEGNKESCVRRCPTIRFSKSRIACAILFPQSLGTLSARLRNMVRPRLDLAVENSDGELIVLDKNVGKVHQLNQSAALVWHGLSEGLVIDEIAIRIIDAFDVGRDKAVSDVQTTITQLRDLGLLVD